MEDLKSQVTTISVNLNNLEANTVALEERILKKISSVLDSHNEKQLRREITAIEQIFKEASHKIKSELKLLADENERLRRSKKDTHSIFLYETRKNHWHALTLKFRKICSFYRSIQVKYRNDEEQKLISYYLIEFPEFTTDQIREQIRNYNNVECLKKTNVSGKASFNVAEQRNIEIKKITETIDDLCLLIDELHEMVRTHRGLLDRIEVKMTGSLNSTYHAKKNLQTALKYQMSSSKIVKLFLTILTVILITLFIYTMIKWSFRPQI